MAFCDDPALTYLNDLGYNVVRLPRTGLMPLEVLGSEAGAPFEQIGRLSTVWQSTFPEPPVTDGDTTGISGKSTSNIKVDFGLKILGGILGAMGAAVPQLDIAYARASSVRFEFRDPAIKKIDPFTVGKYLSQGDLDSSNPVVRSYMLNDENSAYVVTEVLLSKAIRVTALDKGGTNVAVDLPAVQNAVGIKLGVGLNAATEGDLVYQGEKFLAFGFKAHEIVYIGDRWNVRRLNPGADAALLAGEEPELAPPVRFQGRRFLGAAASAARF